MGDCHFASRRIFFHVKPARAPFGKSASLFYDSLFYRCNFKREKSMFLLARNIFDRKNTLFLNSRCHFRRKNTRCLITRRVFYRKFTYIAGLRVWSHVCNHLTGASNSSYFYVFSLKCIHVMNLLIFNMLKSLMMMFLQD